MKMTNDEKDDQALEALFQSARDEGPGLEPDFMARLVADAEKTIETKVQSPAPTQNEAGLWASIVGALVPVSGLAAATLAGVWIGFQVPSSDFTDSLAFSDGTDFDVSAFLPAAALSGFSDLETDG